VLHSSQKGRLGVIVHVARWSNASFSDDDLASLLTIGSIVGVALECAVLSEDLTRSRDRLRALAAANVQAREEEARRIAHELHDEAGQLLTQVHLAVDEIVSCRLPFERRNGKRSRASWIRSRTGCDASPTN
jgi:signal transduction histidine kinase